MPYLKPNTDAPFGALPADGAQRVRHYSKASSTNAIFAGDFVTLNSSGQVQSIANLSDVILGVAAESVASGSTTTCAVYDDPDQLFVMQDDGVGTGMSQSLIGELYQLTGLTPGTAAQVTRNRSITQVDTSTHVTSNTAAGQQVQVVALSQIESGFPTGAGSPMKVIVKINPFYHFYATTAGV